jgi:hypothetical protein
MNFKGINRHIEKLAAPQQQKQFRWLTRQRKSCAIGARRESSVAQTAAEYRSRCTGTSSGPRGRDAERAEAN